MISSIPKLIEEHGSMAAACRETGLNEMTLAKYRFDESCDRHVIYNGRLMTWRETSTTIYSRRGVTKTDRANGL